MCEKFAPSIPVNRLLGRSIFGDVVRCVKVDASEDTQETTSLSSCLMWNNDDVYGGIVRLNIL